MKIEEILDSIGDKLFNYLAIKLGSPLDAEDVLQEVFCRLVKYNVRFRIIRNPTAYIFRMARNEAISFLKHKKKDLKSHHSVEGLSKVIQENLTGLDPQVLKQTAEALAKIPAGQREVIVLKFFEELTFREISNVCNVSIGTVTSRYRYGMEKLRKLLED
jgi:RNA polymerase sigma-70 factor (ECF subfamily)